VPALVDVAAWIPELEGERAMPSGKPNIVVFWGDDIGISNLSCY